MNAKLKKMIVAGAAFALMANVSYADGVVLTESNPMPPRSYSAGSIKELFEKQLEIRVMTPDKPTWKYNLADRARYDSLPTRWDADLTMVPAFVQLTYGYLRADPEVRVTLYSNVINFRLSGVGGLSSSGLDETDLIMRSDMQVSIHVEITTYPYYHMAQKDVAALVKAAREQKPLRFHGEFITPVGANTVAELKRRFSDMTFHINRIEDPQTKPEEPAGKPQDKCPLPDGCHP